MLQMSMSKLSLKVLLGVFALMFSVSAGLSTECKDDPNGNLLELLHFISHPDKNQWFGHPYSTGFTHIALTVCNVDEMCECLRNVGLDIPIQPQCSPDGSVKVIYVRGPEGILIELVELIE